MHRILLLSLPLVLLACQTPRQQALSAGEPLTPETVTVTTVAMRVHDLEAMEAFYSEAFGVEFRDVDTFGIVSRFGRLGDLELKLVPLRESRDFEGYAEIQLGIEVPGVVDVIQLAQRHGGTQEGDLHVVEGRVHGAVRDPDGNTIELYEVE